MILIRHVNYRIQEPLALALKKPVITFDRKLAKQLDALAIECELL